MKIAYVLGGNFTQHPGLVRKVSDSIRVWENEGYDVLLIPFGEMRTISSVDKMKSIEIENNGRFRRLRLLFDYFGQYRYLKAELKKFNPNIVYGRYTLPMWSPWRAFGVKSQYVLEINSDDSVEYGLKSSITGLINRLFRKSFINRAGGLVFVTDDLNKSDSFSFYRKNKITIANGVNCSESNFPFPDGAQIAVVGIVRSPNQVWHGVDKVIRLAKLIPDTLFEVIGGDINGFNNEYPGVAVPGNVRFLGYLKGKELDERLCSWTVGISSLALHRINMSEACPLKSRHYLSLGIPIIFAYDDPDISGTEAFCLNISNVETNIEDHLSEIEAFIHRCAGNTELRESAFKFAMKVLSVQSKELKRLTFFQRVIANEKD